MNQMDIWLEEWFLKHRYDKPDKLSHSLTFKIMKEYLKPMGYWKNKARGKPDAKYFKKGK